MTVGGDAENELGRFYVYRGLLLLLISSNNLRVLQRWARSAIQVCRTSKPTIEFPPRSINCITFLDSKVPLCLSLRFIVTCPSNVKASFPRFKGLRSPRHAGKESGFRRVKPPRTTHFWVPLSLASFVLCPASCAPLWSAARSHAAITQPVQTHGSWRRRANPRFTPFPSR